MERTMGKMSRQLTVVAGLVCGVLVLYIVVRAISSLNQGYTWEEMDWHQRGRTTFADFLAASDIGRREVIGGGRRCIEYFAYKDGSPVKTVCLEDDKWTPSN